MPRGAVLGNADLDAACKRLGVGRAGGGGLGARGEAAELLDIVDPKGDEAKKR